jgi:hypothetical protein
MIVGVRALIGSAIVASLKTSQSIISLSTLFLSFSPSGGYISIMLISDTRWIWQSMQVVPTLVQIYMLSPIYLQYSVNIYEKNTA